MTRNYVCSIQSCLGSIAPDSFPSCSCYVDQVLSPLTKVQDR